MQAPVLSGRGAAVLDAVVESFIRSGEPVGSVILTRTLPERVSPATVRNVMAELERLGYLEQPHTSAGRMPTAQGYRRYVENLRVEGRLDPVDEAGMLAELGGEPMEVHELLRRSCRLLADLSDLVGLVSAPPLCDTVFQHIDFVALDGNRVMAIVVARSGQVKNRMVTLDEALPQEQLDRAAHYLVRRFAGRSLREVARRISELHNETSERLEAVERQALSLGASAMTTELEVADVHVQGATRLLSHREFGAREDVQVVLEAIERRRELAQLLAAGEDEHEPRVFIGAETLPEALGGCSLVAATYWSGGHALGSVAVLGPTRLPYARAISLVDAIARVTSNLFSQIGA